MVHSWYLILYFILYCGASLKFLPQIFLLNCFEKSYHYQHCSTPTLREDKWMLESSYHARIATGPQDTTAMSPDPWSKFTWGTKFLGYNTLYIQVLIGPSTRPCLSIKRVIVTPAIEDTIIDGGYISSAVHRDLRIWLFCH